jgi:2-dehydro-3-deoxygluconokinase
MILNAHKAFPHVSVFANTLREVISANEHLWGAIVYENGNWYEAPISEDQRDGSDWWW